MQRKKPYLTKFAVYSEKMKSIPTPRRHDLYWMTAVRDMYHMLTGSTSVQFCGMDFIKVKHIYKLSDQERCYGIVKLNIWKIKQKDSCSFLPLIFGNFALLLMKLTLHKFERKIGNFWTTSSLPLVLL